MKNLTWALLLLVTIFGCSKKNENYKSLIENGEIYYPGVVSNINYRAGNLRTLLIWNPSPDPKIVKYKIYWNNKQDSMIVSATSHNPLDTVKLLVSNLKEGTYNFNVYSVDTEGHVSVTVNINGVRVYGPIYTGGLFNRGYNAATPYTVNMATGSVTLNFNAPDSINLKTLIKFTNNTGIVNTVVLSPDSSTITLNDFKFGTNVTYQSFYIPQKDAIDTFAVANESTYPDIRRIGDITSFYIKNPGSPFFRGDNGTGKWGLPKDWQYNTNVVNQNSNTGGGWSTDQGGCIHFESKDWGGPGVNNGKVYQTITLPAGNYALDFTTAGYGGTINANEVVAAGTVLPDITNLPGNTLAMYHGDQNSIGGVHTLSFILNQSTTITLGWVVSTDVYTYLQFTRVVLRSL